MNASPGILKANDVVIELIHRARATPEAPPGVECSLTNFSNEQLLTRLEVWWGRARSRRCT